MIMNKIALQRFRTDFDRAVCVLAAKYEVEIKMKAISYEEDRFHFKTEVVNADAESQELKDFKQFAESFGLKPEDLGATFVFRHETFEILGLKPKSPKFNLLCKSMSTDKKILFRARTIAHKLHPELPPVVPMVKVRRR